MFWQNIKAFVVVDCDWNRALGFDPNHGCNVWFFICILLTDIGSDVIDRIRLGFKLCILKVVIVSYQDKIKNKAANRFHEDRDLGSSGSLYKLGIFVNPETSLVPFMAQTELNDLTRGSVCFIYDVCGCDYL